ncbi:hypothetical protein P692DRAFT_20879646 [Suillus brevipes Sb2]|nr:hypothetical protein P692DRAFT_20879646 [Suillus brevipes Sb2]
MDTYFSATVSTDFDEAAVSSYTPVSPPSLPYVFPPPPIDQSRGSASPPPDSDHEADIDFDFKVAMRLLQRGACGEVEVKKEDASEALNGLSSPTNFGSNLFKDRRTSVLSFSNSSLPQTLPDQLHIHHLRRDASGKTETLVIRNTETLVISVTLAQAITYLTRPLILTHYAASHAFNHSSHQSHQHSSNLLARLKLSRPSNV